MHTSRRRRGANAVEFALTFPIFMMIVLGTIDFGWLAWNRTSLVSAAATACRSGSTRDPGVGSGSMAAVYAFTRTQIETRMAADGLPCSPCTIVIDTVAANPDRSLRCKVTRTAQPLTGFIQAISGGRTLTGTSVSRFEYQR